MKERFRGLGFRLIWGILIRGVNGDTRSLDCGGLHDGCLEGLGFRGLGFGVYKV